MLQPILVMTSDPRTGTGLTSSACPLCGINAAAVADWSLHSQSHGA